MSSAMSQSMLALSLFLGVVGAQSVAVSSPEVHPKLQTYKCTKRGGCVAQTSSLVLDSGTHPTYQVADPSLGCGSWGSAPNITVCPDATACAENCVMEGISNYTSYGITTSNSDLYMSMLSPTGAELSPRVYLLDEEGKDYEMLQLTGGELAFDVDVSKLPCGMNGALYLSEMDQAGGRNTLNPGGASYGTGYCDAQCFVSPFLNGVGNIEGLGACCNEMDIWEANALATQIAPHVCNHTGLYGCAGEECAFDGVCDKNGCGYNTYVVGDDEFYGPHLTVDTTRPFTVVTQFPASLNGTLQEIRRLYVQDGKIIQNGAINVTANPWLPDINYIDDEYCTAAGATEFMELGAVNGMGGALKRGMVLIFSIWWDSSGFMDWLDNGNAGPCNATEGNPAVITAIQPDPTVTFSQIKWGEINSTFAARGVWR